MKYIFYLFALLFPFSSFCQNNILLDSSVVYTAVCSFEPHMSLYDTLVIKEGIKRGKSHKHKMVRQRPPFTGFANLINDPYSGYLNIKEICTDCFYHIHIIERRVRVKDPYEDAVERSNIHIEFKEAG